MIHRAPCIPPVPLHKIQFTYEFLRITKVVGQNDGKKTLIIIIQDFFTLINANTVGFL